MSNDSNLEMRAEHLAEMAAEADTKKEAAAYWREYRQVMIQMTGDKNMFRRQPCYTNRPSRALIRTMKRCPCGATGFQWNRQGVGYMNDTPVVMFMCPKCEAQTGWHQRNSDARDEWNRLASEACR